MAFPTTTITTNNLNSGTDSPSLARTDLLAAVTALNTIISEADTASGVALLTAGGTYDSAKLPSTFSPGTTLTLAPSTGIVNIQDVLRLTALPANDISGLTSALGDIALSSDADGGDPAICFYDGADWRYLALSSLTIL